MLSFRMHHIQPYYRVQFLIHLHSLASMPYTNQTQIHLSVESTTLKLITGLGAAEVLPQLQRYFTDSKMLGNIVSTESEEFNRALILTVAQAMHITCTGIEDQQNAWVKELLQNIMQYTPHTWGSLTLQCFPPILSSFYAQSNVTRENMHLLKKCVEDEYGKFASMTNENDIISHFTAPATPPIFLCLLFKMVLETDTITAAAYKYVFCGMKKKSFMTNNILFVCICWIFAGYSIALAQKHYLPTCENYAITCHTNLPVRDQIRMLIKASMRSMI